MAIVMRAREIIVSKKLLSTILLFAVAILVYIPYHEAFAQNCMELGTCDMSDQPFQIFLQPYLLTIGDLIYVIVWGIVIMLIYMRNDNPLLSGIVGLVIAATMTGTSFTTEFPTIQHSIQLGLILFAMALAFFIFTLFRSKINAQ